MLQLCLLSHPYLQCTECHIISKLIVPAKIFKAPDVNTFRLRQPKSIELCMRKDVS